MDTIDRKLEALSKSNFRSRFGLKEKDLVYVKEKGMDTIYRHAQDFIRTRLADSLPKNDGKQTPMRGHPVFIAQHATATCCRGCIYKWHRIPQGRKLTPHEQEFIAQLIMRWIEREVKKHEKTSL